MNKPTQLDLSIIVVSFNTRVMTLECLRSVFTELQNRSFEVIVLDNASTDGSAEAIRQEFGDRLELIRSRENIGFAAGNNEAVQLAKGRYILLLNPDTVVLHNAIDRLVDFARRTPDNGVWGGRTLFADRSLNPASCWARQTLWSLACQATGLSSLCRRSNVFNPEGMGGWDRSGEREVDIVSGCFLLIRRDLWLELGGFRETFFMYGEEADLCLRATTLGARPITTSSATIVHYGGGSEKVQTDKIVRLLKAKMDLIRLHFPSRQRTLGYALLTLWPRSRWLFHAVLAFIGRDKSVKKRDMWRQVTNRRKVWSVSADAVDEQGTWWKI